VNALGWLRASPSAPVTAKIGIQPNQMEIHFDTGMIEPCRK